MRHYLKKIDKSLIVFVFTIFSLVFAISLTALPRVFATSEEEEATSLIEDSGYHHITIYDGNNKLSIKSEAKTVAEILERANIELNEADIVEPTLDSPINADDFFINIYRSRPALVVDGTFRQFIMTASFDAKVIAEEAGLAIYDGDIVSIVPNSQFLELGVAAVYEVKRGDGSTLTTEEEIPFEEVSNLDYTLEAGKSEVIQLGEVGQKTTIYSIQTKNGNEISREVISETITREPVARVVRVGAKKPVPPEREECASWARAAGVSEADLTAALDLIYHESGCRVSAQNTSSGAYGIPQALPGSKMASKGDDWQTNPVTQIRWMIDYVNGRYGGWSQALNYWYTYHWY